MSAYDPHGAQLARLQSRQPSWHVWAPVKKGDGTNAGTGWGSMDAIANAVTAFDAKDMPTISEAMGGGHKVRSFYNNIIAPWSRKGDVTGDTHAIAAANLRPMAGDDKDVNIGLGATPRNRATGAGASVAPILRRIGRRRPSAASSPGRCNRSPGRRCAAFGIRRRSLMLRSTRMSRMSGTSISWAISIRRLPSGC